MFPSLASHRMGMWRENSRRGCVSIKGRWCGTCLTDIQARTTDGGSKVRKLIQSQDEMDAPLSGVGRECKGAQRCFGVDVFWLATEYESG